MSDKVLTGSQLRFVIWHDATFGNETPGTAFELPVLHRGIKIGEMQELLESAVARSGRGEAQPLRGAHNADGLTVEVKCGYDSLPHILKQVVADTLTETGTDPYTHSGVLGALSVGFGAELAIVDPDTAANSKLYQCFGCFITKLRFNFAGVSGEVTLQITFSAKKVTKSTGTPHTATTYVETLINLDQADTFTINGSNVTDVVEGYVEVDTAIKLHKTSHNDGRAGKYSIGKTKIRITMKALMHADEAYSAFAENATVVPVVCGFSSGTDSWVNTFKKVEIEPFDLVVQGPDEVPIDLNGIAYEVDSDADSPWKTEVTNGVTGDYA